MGNPASNEQERTREVAEPFQEFVSHAAGSSKTMPTERRRCRDNRPTDPRAEGDWARMRFWRFAASASSMVRTNFSRPMEGIAIITKVDAKSGDQVPIQRPGGDRCRTTALIASLENHGTALAASSSTTTTGSKSEFGRSPQNGKYPLSGISART